MGGTHCTGVRYDVRNVIGGIDRRCAVRAIVCDIGEAWNDEGEALAVDDVPVERIDLGSSHQALLAGWEMIHAREPKNTRQAYV
jgi:hypothetical protein